MLSIMKFTAIIYFVILVGTILTIANPPHPKGTEDYHLFVTLVVTWGWVPHTFIACVLGLMALLITKEHILMTEIGTPGGTGGQASGSINSMLGGQSSADEMQKAMLALTGNLPSASPKGSGGGSLFTAEIPLPYITPKLVVSVRLVSQKKKQGEPV